MKRYTIAFLAVLLSGCGLLEGLKCKETRAYLAEDITQGKIRRVVVLPLMNPSRYSDAGPLVTETLCGELRKAGVFHIQPVSQWQLAEMVHQTGVVLPRAPNDHELGLIAKATGADAIVVGTVTQYMPYRPMVLGIRVRMVRAADKEVIWAVDEVYDSSLEEVVNLTAAYSRKVKNVGKWTEGWYDWEKALVSMRYFTQFVCYEVAKTVKGTGPSAPRS